MKTAIKITSMGLLTAMVFSLAACGNDFDINDMNIGPEYSVVVFDNKKFDINNATATLYFGNPTITHHVYDDRQFYAQAFFSSVTVRNIWKVILNAPDEEVVAVMQRIDELPLESTAEDIYTENVIYVVHHETDEEVYFSGEYGVERTYNQELLTLESVYFNHSQRVKIPAELFTEDEGTISFIYYTMDYDKISNSFPYSGGASMDISYKKKKGKIRLERTEFYSGLKGGRVKVKNLEK